MRDSHRYREQAETVVRLAAKAQSPAEREVYMNIADGWRRLAAEAQRNESHDPRRAPRQQSAPPAAE